jgi:hypothetical protein
MQGCVRLGLLLALLLLTGCRQATEPEEPPAPVEALGQALVAENTGTIQGQVSWRGDLPIVPPFQVHAFHDYSNTQRLRGVHSNPHAPHIDPETRGVGEVVLLLRQVKPELSKPWRHPPVQVQIEPDGLGIVQGETRRAIGLVRRGADITCVSRDAQYHTLRARGAAFFTLPFVDADRPSRRRLDQTGVVELVDGPGFYWRRAYLFVLEHPHAVISDRTGRFVLDHVPAGTYQLVAWLPNWNVARQEHDPETAIVNRMIFAPAVEVEQTVTVRSSATCEATVNLSTNLFDATKDVER